MTVETASKLRIHRSASCASVAPSGTSGTQLVDDLEAELEVDAREGLADVELLAVAVEGAVVVGREARLAANFPVSKPDASGTRTMTPTSRRRACSKKSSAGRWRKMLKMICTVETLGYSIAFSASSTFSTLTPYARTSRSSTSRSQASKTAGV